MNEPQWTPARSVAIRCSKEPKRERGPAWCLARLAAAEDGVDVALAERGCTSSKADSAESARLEAGCGYCGEGVDAPGMD